MGILGAAWGNTGTKDMIGKYVKNQGMEYEK
jgi:hypothetical protein